MAQVEEGHEAHSDTDVDDVNDEDDDDDDDDDNEDDHDDDNDELEMNNNDDEDDTISLLDTEVVAPKETGTKRKEKDPVPMNIVGLENFTVENTQPLQRSSRPPKATKKFIGRDKEKAVASSILFKKNV